MPNDIRQTHVTPCTRKKCRYYQNWITASDNVGAGRALMAGRVEGDNRTPAATSVLWCVSCKDFKPLSNFRKAK